jgi:hypothetical protein
MKIYTSCKECKNEISTTSSAPTRLDYVMHSGENLHLQCMKCGDRSDYHIDEMYAKTSRKMALIGALIALVGTPIVLYFLYYFTLGRGYIWLEMGAIIAIPTSIYLLIKEDDRRRVKSFNQIKVNK